MLLKGLQASSEPCAPDQADAMSVAADLLSGLGAEMGDRDSADLVLLAPVPFPSPVTGVDAGLPNGAIAHATGVTVAAAALATWWTGRPVRTDGLGVAVEMWLPEVMAAAYDSPVTMRPRAPRPAPGKGWMNADLGASGDEEMFERLLETLPPRADAAAVAAAAQAWRLAVCDYRRFQPEAAASPVRISAASPVQLPAGAIDGPAGTGPVLRVCDLTAMWAGPLATRLLAGLGADVTKVEPSFRPDGTRAIGGGGIYPHGRQVDPGRDSATWNALNADKRHVDLDLRDHSQQHMFVELARSCDVVIDSFSPRVMTNFGVMARIGSGPVHVSMPAFGPGPRRDWVAYGSGVHACLGLGDGTGSSGDASDNAPRFWAPAVSYPDPLAGLTGVLAVLAGVIGRRRGVPVRSVEVSLAGAIQPLLARYQPGVPSQPPAGLGAQLLSSAAEAGLMEPRPVGGLDLLHPVGPFRHE